MSILTALSTIDFIRVAVGCQLVIPVIVKNIGVLLASGSVLIPLLVLSRNHKRKPGRKSHSEVPSMTFYPRSEKADKIDRYFSSQEKIDLVNAVVNEFLIKNRSFLQPKYSLRQLAQDVNIPLHYLSAFINRYHKMNYNDFINRFRVFVSIEMISNGECKHKTLEAIAAECGFNNRNTFTSAFKKETGKSPSAFLKEIKKNQSERTVIVHEKRIYRGNLIMQ